MKSPYALIVLISLLIISCEKDESDPGCPGDGFCIKIADNFIITHRDIEYYDISSHIIYLKREDPFLETITEVENFTVYADGIEFQQ